MSASIIAPIASSAASENGDPDHLGRAALDEQSLRGSVVMGERAAGRRPDEAAFGIVE
ncbi:MAG TPA: hypothetical protein VKX28_32450 [Xanthobacteraceae bacterium]|nr:hypothetical protein [Xanthobacteraceae bacterium]